MEIGTFSKEELKVSRDAFLLEEGDTIFVSYYTLDKFVADFLPVINTSFVLISTPRGDVPVVKKSTSQKIVENPFLLRWFATNIGKFTGGKEYHPLVSPFPLGLKSNVGSREFQQPIPHYKKAFLEFWNTSSVNKKQRIFAGQLSKTSNFRKNIPSGPRLPYQKYLREIANSEYVISPDGKHPDCHRHYEALGLGAVPITQMNPYLYSHLNDGPVIFNNSEWDLKELEKILPSNITVNRNMIFEEYWMEHVESIVQRPLKWWDVLQQKPSRLENFVIN